MTTCNCSNCKQKTWPTTSLEAWRKNSCFGGGGHSFWGWDHEKLRVKAKSACSSVVRQSSNSHGCPDNTLGRYEIAKALKEAEQTFRDQLGYSVVPEWHKETIDAYKWGCTQGWRNTGKVVLPFGNVVAVGKEKYEELATVTLGTAAYKIEAIDGPVNDTFTLGFSGAYDIPAEEIRVYLNKSDRLNTRDSIERWEIPTENITVENGVVTIVGKSWLLARPALYEAYTPFGGNVSHYADYSLDPQQMGNYVQRLDIMRVTVDSCEGGHYLYKRACGCPVCKSDQQSCYECSNVAFCIEDSRSGIVSPIWNWGGDCGNHPKKFCVNYKTDPCNRDWITDIVKLSISLLCSNICTCAYGCMSYWWEDLAHENAKTNTSFDVLGNPIGTRRGQIHAWNLISKFRSNSFSL